MTAGIGGSPDLISPPGGGPDAGDRGSRILDSFRAEGAKGVSIAVASTVAVIALIVFAVLHSSHWLEVKEAFFNSKILGDSFPEIFGKFLRNVQFFMIAEPIILMFALLLAVLRSLPGPVFFPLRAMATIYVDVVRGIPTILLIYLLGFGIPALQIPGVPGSAVFWGVTAVILSYSAYVAEVYRAGIESIHPSQAAAARSLGLSRWQALRFVIVPQAVRRVIPPLLNDFIALQKDTALISIVAGFYPEAFLQSQIDQSATFNFTPVLGAAICFLIITIPMTRFTDWLIARQRRRRQAGAAL